MIPSNDHRPSRSSRTTWADDGGIEQLLTHFDRLIQTPESVQRLRRFILDLAVRGKLVPQDPDDEPAAELLKRIGKEKARLVKAGEIKESKIKPIHMADAPFELPPSWKWTALGTFFLYDAGIKREPKTLKQDLWLLELEDVEKDTGRLLARIKVSERESKSTKSEFRIGDILYGKLRPYLNKVLVADEPGYSTTEIIALRPYLPICSQYCALALQRPDFVAYVTRLGQGTKMPRLRTVDAAIAPFPLPPLAEQRRIVAKVDELMGLCDRLEAARAERETARTRLATASLARLNAPTPDEAAFREHVVFALNNLPPLTTRPEQVKALRQTILNLAVRGKLVPQDPDEEPASELLKRIAKEKARLVKAGEIRETKALPSISKGRMKFEIPNGWSWCCLGNLSTFVTSGSRDWAKYYSQEGAIFVRMGNLSKEHYGLRLGQIQHVKPPSGHEGTRTRLETGDLLISITGDVGMLGLIPENFGEAYINQHTAMVRPMDEMKSRYLAELFRSPFAQDQFNAPQRGIKNSFRLTDITQFLVPLPPLAEQHRIVAKVDALMEMCDRLEAILEDRDDGRGRLVNVVLDEALEPNRNHPQLTVD